MTLQRIWSRLDIAIHNCQKAQVFSDNEYWYQMESWYLAGIELIERLQNEPTN